MNKTLCASPWVHFHVIANGNFYPCCQWQTEIPLGNIETSSLKELIDGQEMNLLRRNMLDGKPSEGCKRCYELEANAAPSVRQSINKKYLKDLNLGPHDANSEKFRLKHFDVRFSNICNLKCRSCGVDFSSSWYEDQVALYGKDNYTKFITTSQSEAFWTDLNTHLHDVTSVYFAGGEPLLEKRHYNMLQYFIDTKRTNVEINYTTNFSQLTFNNFKVLPYWQQLTDVSIYASLDGAGKRGEYLRKGIVWKNIEKNIQTLKDQAPQVRFKITPTISAYNIDHWPDFHKEWIENGWIQANDIHTNYLTNPDFMSAQILPLEYKSKVVKKYLDHIEYLKIIPHSEQAQQQFSTVVHFLTAQDYQNKIPDFLKETEKLDHLRGENLFEVFPELECLATNSNSYSKAQQKIQSADL